MIEITCPGPPVPKGRPRFTVYSAGGRQRTRIYTPGKTRVYEVKLAGYAAEAMKGQAPLDGPLSVIMKAFFPIPKSWTKARKRRAHYVTSKPDLDNIAKSLDALNNIVFKDDAQVVDLFVRKLYDEQPRLEITVQRMPDMGEMRE